MHFFRVTRENLIILVALTHLGLQSCRYIPVPSIASPRNLEDPGRNRFFLGLFFSMVMDSKSAKRDCKSSRFRTIIPVRKSCLQSPGKMCNFYSRKVRESWCFLISRFQCVFFIRNCMSINYPVSWFGSPKHTMVCN